MTGTLEVPLWLGVVAGLLAAWAAWDKLLVPALRWFVSSRANRVIDEIGARLKIRIRPFQRTRRQALIHRLATDPLVLQAAERHAAERRMSEAEALALVERYAREIVPAFNAYLYFRVGYWLGRSISRALYRVRLGYVDAVGLAHIDPDATVVFVMNHRSNMDYVLAAYLAADQAALSYAVGEWARRWPLSALVRAMGAYFVRRDSRDALYRRVLERYVAMATEAGVPQALFPEGGLTRDGRMRAPRLGVLDYMLRGFRADGERDLVFVPLGLNYDRVLEDRSLLLADDPAARRPGAARALWNTGCFAWRNLVLMARSEWHRFGYACVNFGAPVSMRAYCRARALDLAQLSGEPRRAAVAALGEELMQAVGRVVPVLPVPLIATVFARHPERALSELEVKAEAEALIETLGRNNAQLYVPRRDLDYALHVGLRMLRLRRLVDEADGLYSARPNEARLLAYYANSIAHLLG
jgi:glycerol-3-phosphate O-acyltransferase